VEAIGDLLQALPFDKPHCVEWPAFDIQAQAVDRHDTRVLQPAGDFGLEQEPRAAGRVVRVLLEDLLQRHLAV
jgi:hypothetical protein